MTSYILVIIGVSLFINSIATQCIWSPRELPFKDPVLYQRSSKDKPRLLIPASEKGLNFNNGQTVFVACPGSGNYLSKFGLEEAEITCIGGTEILIAGKNGTTKDLECKRTVSGDIKPTNEDCGDVGKTLSVGYNTQLGWMQLFEVCYDFTTSIPLYSHHTVYGNLISAAYVGGDRPQFKSTGLPSNIPMNSAYKRKSQTKVFQNLLGTSEDISNNTFLSRGHLSPDADFIFHSWQRSTYFYANVVPQWMTINGGNWQVIEKLIRDAAKNKNSNLKVWTGATDVLKLNDTNGNEVKMYLSKNDRLPIPKYIWKVACTVSKSCIVFVVHNNPFEAHDISQDICANKCKETEWFKDHFENVLKGYVFCCELNDFKKAFNVLPDIVGNNLLYK